MPSTTCRTGPCSASSARIARSTPRVGATGLYLAARPLRERYATVTATGVYLAAQRHRRGGGGCGRGRARSRATANEGDGVCGGGALAPVI